MMYEEEMNTQSGGGFFMGLLCGVALGATAALMFAPFAGSEARERLAKEAQRLKDKTGDAYDRVSKTVDETMKKAGQAFNQAAEPISPDYRS